MPYLALAAVLLLGGGGLAYYDHHQKVEAEVAAEAKKTATNGRPSRETCCLLYR